MNTNNIEVLFHSCVKITDEKIMYIDPFKIDENLNDADTIFITHNHYDHYSEEDLRKVIKNDTTIVAPESLYENILNFGIEKNKIIKVIPNNHYEFEDITFYTVPAYNTNKQFHPKENGWVGYLINYKNIQYFIAGDTDANDDNKKVKCDVAFVPIGGTYTMTAEEAAEFINMIRPKVAVPIHYGSIVGKKSDAQKFAEKVDKQVEVKILIK